MARLDRLMTGKVIAQLGATIGRQFSYELLQKISQLDGLTLQRELGRLVEAELVYQRGLPPQATYTFKHALIQDAAYQSLLKSTRQQYHQRIAHVLETQFTATVDQQPELLAHHYTEASLPEQAVHYWYHAGQRASERSAHVEAIAHLRQGLALLQTLPETPDRVQQEVDMHIALGASLIATQSAAGPEVEQTYSRARQLCQHLDDPQQLFPVLRGLWNYYYVRAELQTANILGEQLLTLAQQAQNHALLSAAHRAVGATRKLLGDTAAAHAHFRQGIAIYDAQQHRTSAFLYGRDTGVACRSHAASTLWLLGYPAQGLARSHEAVTLAQQIDHPFKPTVSLDVIAVVASSCGYSRGHIEPHAAQECTVHVATQRGRAKRLQHRHPPCVQPAAPMRECPCRRPRLPPRRGTAEAPSREQGHPGGAHGRRHDPSASPCHGRRCPPVSLLFASGPWLLHTGCSLQPIDMTVQ